MIWLHTDIKKSAKERFTDDILLKDLIVPLKIIYDDNIKSKNISVSLDPLIPNKPDGPEYTKVYYPK